MDFSIFNALASETWLAGKGWNQELVMASHWLCGGSTAAWQPVVILLFWVDPQSGAFFSGHVSTLEIGKQSGHSSQPILALSSE